MLDGIVYMPETLGYIDGYWPEALKSFQQRLKQLQVFRNAVPSFFGDPLADTHEIGVLVDLVRDT